jgi:transcriptional regulator with XRE-family HTH domain
MNHRERIGKQLMHIRESKGITQIQLAEMTGYDQSNISKIERGRYNVSIDIIQKVCDALGVRIEVVE